MFDFLSEKFSAVFSRFTGKPQLTEDNIHQAIDSVRDALLEADVPLNIATAFLDELKKEAIGQKVLKSLKPGDQFIKLVHEKLVQFLGGQVGSASAPVTFQIPSIIMVMGLQGSGKTTTISKLASYIKAQAAERGKTRSILCASVDFYRPAAIDQLELLAQSTGTSFYRATATEPVLAAQEILSYSQKNQFELLILDTAGRLHVDARMLEELRAIDTLVQPKYKFLVLDAMTGQESLHVASAFDQGVGFSATILTKMDSGTRAGAAFAFRYALKKPILFVGTGEKPTDLEPFRPERMANRILGMGDVLTLIEKAEAAVKKTEQEKMAKSFQGGKMNLQDFADQLGMLNKIGSLGAIAQYLPGMGGLKVSEEQLEKGERELKKFKAIISSMTKKERFYPKILDQSRKSRIAQGAGVSVSEVNLMLSRFDQMQQFAKLFKRFGR